MHSTIEIILGLLLAVALLAALAEKLAIPYPILIVLGGLVLGFIPGLPRVEINPELVFLVFLPPLITSAAWNIPWREFRLVLSSVLLLSTGLVLATVSAVAVVAHAVIAGMPWSAAFVLGAVVSPTDAVAATAISRRLGVPQRIVTLLESESLVNDATGLVAYRLAVAATVSGVFSAWEAGLRFLGVTIGGVLIGLTLGWLIAWLHRRLDDPLVEIILTFFMSYASYLLAEQLGVSGVLAAMTIGLYHRWLSPELLSPKTRIQSAAVWEMIVFIFNGLIFILLGLQLPIILDTISGQSTASLVWYASLISAVVIGVRLLWVFPGARIARLLSHRLKEADPSPSWQGLLLVGWTGMRGVLSLAAALSIPLTTHNGTPFPERDLIIFLTFCVILVTLVLQGLILPSLIRWLHVADDGHTEQEEVDARLKAAQSAVMRLDELIAKTPDLAKVEMVQWLQAQYQDRICRLSTGCDVIDEGYYGEVTNFSGLQRQLLAAERETVVKLRNQSIISDEVLQHIERDLDLEDARLG